MSKHNADNNGKTFSVLRWFCPPHLLEEIEGDLLQRFERDVSRVGIRSAKWRLLWNTVRFLRPSIIKRNKINLPMPLPLIQNNLTMTFRAMRKEKAFTSINILGLTISMAACLLILQYVFFELSYDQQFPKSIYRVGTITYQDGIEFHSSALTPFRVSSQLKGQIPDVKEVVHLYSTSGWFDCTLTYETEGQTKVFNENRGFYFADPAVLSLFQIELVEGDQATALSRPYSLVLSQSTAKKYFGDQSAIGKVLKHRGSFASHDFTVTGVMPDFPENSHLDFRILGNFSSLGNWDTDIVSYLQLVATSDPANVIDKINLLGTRLNPPTNRQHQQYILEPIAAIHLQSKLEDQFKLTGNRMYIYLLLATAGIIMIIAWINYVNLTTAHSLSRAKEVGLRKVIGATRWQIAGQFITQTMVVNGISFGLALLLVVFMHRPFFIWLGESALVSQPLFAYLPPQLPVVLVAFLISVLAIGLVPSQYFAKLNPANVLKGRTTFRGAGYSFQKVAVGFQFTVTISLLVVITVFREQFQFMRAQDLGIDISRTVVAQSPTNVDSTYRDRMRGFKAELQNLAIIESIATTSDAPGNFIGSDWSGDIRKSKEDPAVTFGVNVIDPDYIPQFGLCLLAGRNFEPSDYPLENFGDKVESVILTRKACNRLGYANPESAIGQTIYWVENPCRIIGVVEDFHQRSVKEEITPLLLVVLTGPSVAMKLEEGATQNLPATISQIQRSWSKHFPANAFDYYLLEDHFNEQYKADERVARIFNTFCVIALITSCLGLFGLLLFTFQRRIKEIGIRKILGASLSQLFRTLSGPYLRLLLVAAIVSIPLSFFLTSKWLEAFASRVSLEYKVFVLPILAVIGLAVLVLATQVIKVNVANPVDSLKHE